MKDLAKTYYRCLFCFCFIFIGLSVHSQSSTNFFVPADSLDKKRFYTGLGISVISYTGTTIGLYNTWYKQFERRNFHLFNDWNEWKNMDKLGHAYTSYSLANIGYQGARWTGIPEKGRLWVAGVGSTAVQLAIEVMDGFSSKWGFSISDLGFNTLGTATFITQQKLWNEQRIRIKMFSFPKDYPSVILNSQSGLNQSSLQNRVSNLYGNSFHEKFLKDYNAQSLWVSANLKSFFPKSKIPNWLGFALGYSAENMFGGFDNEWTEGDDIYSLNEIDFPRHHQWILSLDIDLDRIKAKSYFWQMFLSLLNQFKFPAPAIEYNSLGEWKFHLIFRN